MIRFFRTLFMRKNSIKGASLILMATLVSSNILGLFRNRFLAQKITPANLDTYLAAFRIPDLIFNLLILGAISSAFIPVFVNYLRRKDYQTAWHVASSVINIAIIVLTIVPIILAIFMPHITPLLVPGFNESQQLQTTQLSRWLLLTPLFFGISYIMGGILNSFKRFIVYSLSPLIYNLSIIIATLLLADHYGVMGVVFGVVGGAFLHMVIQIPTVVKLGFHWQQVADFRHKSVRRIGKLMVPRMIGLGANQLILIVVTFLASTWKGNVTYFNFANDIQTFFSVVFGASFAIAVFPFLADFAADGDKKKFLESLNLAAKQILYFIIPCSVLLFLLRSEIVRLTLGTGHFSWSATVATANSLGAFAIGIWAASLVQLLARAFYAYEDTRTPAIAGIISAIVTIILSFVLSRINLGHLSFANLSLDFPLKAVGLALAVSLGSIFNVVVLAILLRIKLKYADGFDFAKTVFKYLFASVVLGFVAQLIKYYIGWQVNMQTFQGVLLKTTATIVISFGFYLLITYLLKCEEFSAFLEVFKKRVTPPDDIAVDQTVGAKQSQQE